MTLSLYSHPMETDLCSYSHHLSIHLSRVQPRKKGHQGALGIERPQYHRMDYTMHRHILEDQVQDAARLVNQLQAQTLCHPQQTPDHLGMNRMLVRLLQHY